MHRGELGRPRRLGVRIVRVEIEVWPVRAAAPLERHVRIAWPPIRDTHARPVDQKSIRITTRRSVGRLTAKNPASVNMLSVPTWSSSGITFFVVMG